jgi:hypothetical protein
MKFEKISFFVLILISASHLLVNCVEVRNKLSLARYELAGLEKLGIVDLFSNFLRGVKKTFLRPQPQKRFKPDDRQPHLESPDSSKTVLAFQPKPEDFQSSTEDSFFTSVFLFIFFTF